MMFAAPEFVEAQSIEMGNEIQIALKLQGRVFAHGMMGREYDQVLSNTVAAFALGDYEWLLALEADELHDTVDLMRHLRASGARMHVREEVPFFSGRRVDEAGVVEVLR